MILDRTQAPAFSTLSHIDVMPVTSARLSNNIEVFSLKAGSQEIVKIEFVFKAGMYQQPAPLIASATNTLLEAGTRNYTANELSDGIDFYGSFLELQVEQDFASITLYSLNKYLDKSLAFIEEILKYPTFPAEEFRIHVANKRQKHGINTQKVSVLARRRFSELLFGASHPYGVDVQDADFDRINLQEVQDFFSKHYTYLNCTIVASGNLPDNLHGILNRYFGEGNWGGAPQVIQSPALAPQTSAQRRHMVKKDDAIQSAIRIGRVLFNKTHPDYFKFQVLNTVLGGYFGSRLMANIREDKGYTYGIGSGVNNLVHSGVFYISTEVGVDVTAAAVTEIYKEVAKLREELVDADELETVRNYILGNFLRSVDGPFALADKFKSIWEFGLDYSFFDAYFNAVKTVTAAEIRDLANQYLQEKDLLECVVGSM